MGSRVSQQCCKKECNDKMRTVLPARCISDVALLSNTEMLEFQSVHCVGFLAKGVNNSTLIQIFHLCLTHSLHWLHCADDHVFHGIHSDGSCRSCRNLMVNSVQRICSCIGHFWVVHKWTVHLVWFIRVSPWAARILVLALDILQWHMVHVYWHLLIAMVRLAMYSTVVDHQ